MGGIGQAMRLIAITLLVFALTLSDAVADEADAERYAIRDGVIGPQVINWYYKAKECVNLTKEYIKDLDFTK